MGWRITVLALFLLAADSSAQFRRSTFKYGDRLRFGRHQLSEDNYFEPNADRSYKFGYEAEDHSRQEESDKDGLVMGKYSYVDANGIQRSLSYKAGANIGFVPDLSNFSGKERKNMRVVKRPRGMKKPLSNPTRFVTSLIPMQPKWRYPTPVLTPFHFYSPPQPAALYHAPIAPALPVVPLSTLYGAPAAPKPEPLATLYAAPAPPAPKPEPLPTLYGAPAAPKPEPLPTLYAAPAPPAPKPEPLPTLYAAPAPPAPKPEPLPTLYAAPAPPAPEPEPLATLYGAPAPLAPEPDHSNIDMVEEKLNAMMQMDASYSFKYDNEFSSREETADPNGDVKGKYAYTNELGSTIIVHYSAGANKGFVIENMDEIEEAMEEAQEAVAYAEMAIDAFSDEEVVEETDPIEVASIHFEQPTIDQDTWIQSKSYSYSVSGSDSGLTRSETADENGAVTGTYTIPDVNGDPIVVKYRAGPLTGFVIENFDEVQARTDPASASVSQDLSQISGIASSVVPDPIITYAQEIIPTAPDEVIEVNEPFVDPLHEENSDRSYQFSYGSEQDDSLRQEESDADGNIKGKYSYVNAEGNTILVKYSAGPNQGFVVENEQELKGSVQKATSEAAKKVKRRRMKVVKRPRIKPEPLPSYETAPSQNSYQAPHPGIATSYVAPAKQKVVKRPRIKPEPLPSYETAQSQNIYQAPHPGIPSTYVAPAKQNTYQDVEVDLLPTSVTDVDYNNHEENAADLSYSFNVQSENSSYEESQDQEGERTGSYSYIDANGQNVVVRYRAGKDGFVILNPDDVLPKPPQAY